MSDPLIGITGFRSEPQPPLGRFTLNLGENYVRGVQAAGGIPLVIPPNLEERALRGMFERLDGLLLSGGGDIDPALFGEPRHPATANISVERDRSELALARWALAENKPVLGICRGIQVLNVAAGGTLVQHIPDEAPGAISHSFELTVPRAHVAHTVRIQPGACLSRLLGATEAPTNSWHHQSCRAPGQGIVYTAWASDGVVEGAEAPGHRFAVAVQWHPEDLFDSLPMMLSLFRGLVDASAVQP